ncbi:unnamed protein product [Linum tenue]|uniref:Uncharacterized protein n=1 Tax=Linum tenue TaxID=586396 RepID=A0AAV0NFX1_9ROSI|nr:unnamed protein product [Linum tenue]
MISFLSRHANSHRVPDHIQCIKKGKSTHPSALLVYLCGFTKHLSTVHSR